MGLRDRIAEERGGNGAVESESAISVYRRKLLEEVDLNDLAKLNPAQRRARLERVVGRLLTREGPVLSNAERATLIRQIVDASLGLGVLEPLLADESVTEIMVNGPNEVWIERDGKLQQVATTFADDAQLYQTIDRIVSAVNRRVDESSPMVDARLPGGERVNVIIPPLSLKGPAVTIRRFPRSFRMDELIQMGSLDDPIGRLLGACVRGKFNVIVSGGTGTGKTTLLNALSSFIPENERIVTIEDSAELQLQQPHVIALEARPPNVEGKGEVTIRDLVRNSLRMRPDRILVGEVRGAETLDMLQAMNTGHEGSVATVHANSTEDAIMRLETLASMTDLVIPFEALRDQVNGAIDVIIQLERSVDGSRRIVEIAAVASRRRETFRLASIAEFEFDAIEADRRVTGRYRHYPMPEVLRRRLELAGETVPAEFTVAADTSSAPVREAT
jgi:pilus assembly protein CpaF